jgi:hypothetical protein
MAVIQQYRKEKEKDEGPDPWMIPRTTHTLDAPRETPMPCH